MFEILEPELCCRVQSNCQFLENPWKLLPVNRMLQKSPLNFTQQCRRLTKPCQSFIQSELSSRRSVPNSTLLRITTIWPKLLASAFYLGRNSKSNRRVWRGRNSLQTSTWIESVIPSSWNTFERHRSSSNFSNQHLHIPGDWITIGYCVSGGIFHDPGQW